MKRKTEMIRKLGIFLAGFVLLGLGGGQELWAKRPQRCKSFEPEIVDGKKHSEEWRCWPNGRWRLAQHWVEGKLHGQWTLWYATGHKQEEGF